MADRTRGHESITEIVPKTLKTFLEENLPDLRQVIIDFPPPNLKIKMPSVSIQTLNPVFKPTGVPYPRQLPDADNPDAPSVSNHKAAIEWVVGEYDFSMKLDLWAGNKEELDDIFDQLFNVLNPNITPMGVCLKMEEYYGVICDYLYTGHGRNNSEQQSQRDEWRITLDVLATCKAVRDRKEFIIDTFDITSDIRKDVLIPEE